MTWYQVGIVSKELLEIAWRTNVLEEIIVAVAGQVGFLVNTLQSPSLWSLEESTFTRHTAALIGMKISE